jgi:hypothetical protein
VGENLEQTASDLISMEVLALQELVSSKLTIYLEPAESIEWRGHSHYTVKVS